MAGKIYTGPALPLWRRLGLRHAANSVRLFAVLWLALFLGGGWTGWRPPRGLLSLAFVLFAVSVMAVVWSASERRRLAREAPLPQFLKRKLRETYPHLAGKDVELVERGLRQFFLACLRSRSKFVAMPSRVVDSMWHEFILHTRAYREWCDLVFGRFIDHTPAEVLGAKTPTNDGLRRAWYWACRDEAIQPRKPTRLPLLFALDSKLAIDNGFYYVPDCGDIARAGAQGNVYCGESFSDGSYGGDGGGFGGMESDSSGGEGGGGDSGDGGGSDGGGCGGGCGGGGD